MKNSKLMDKYLLALVQDFAELEQVETIALAGSHSLQMNDALSDYDLYIYNRDEIPVETRMVICDKQCRFMDLNNQFWETEDDGEQRLTRLQQKFTLPYSDTYTLYLRQLME